MGKIMSDDLNIQPSVVPLPGEDLKTGGANNSSGDNNKAKGITHDEENALALIADLEAKIFSIEQELKNASSEDIVLYLIGKYYGLSQALAATKATLRPELRQAISGGNLKNKINDAIAKAKMEADFEEQVEFEMAQGHRKHIVDKTIRDIEAVEITEQILGEVGGGAIMLLTGFISIIEGLDATINARPGMDEEVSEKHQEVSKLIAEVRDTLFDIAVTAEGFASGTFEELIGKNKDKAMGQGGFSPARENLVEMFRAIAEKRAHIDTHLEEHVGVAISETLTELVGHLTPHMKREAIEEIEEIIEEMDRVAALNKQNNLGALVAKEANMSIASQSVEKTQEPEEKGLNSLLGKKVGANLMKLEPESPKEQSKGDAEKGGKQNDKSVGNKDLGGLSPDATSKSPEKGLGGIGL